MVAATFWRGRQASAAMIWCTATLRSSSEVNGTVTQRNTWAVSRWMLSIRGRHTGSARLDGWVAVNGHWTRLAAWQGDDRDQNENNDGTQIARSTTGRKTMKIQMLDSIGGLFHGYQDVKRGQVVEVDDENGTRYNAR